MISRKSVITFGMVAIPIAMYTSTQDNSFSPFGRDNMAVISVQSLTKRYKNGIQALDGLTLTVERGEIFSLLGENGAGKSTLIRILTTYSKPTTGSASLFQLDLYREAASIRSKIACVAQRTSIDTHLSLTENMMFQSRLYRVPQAQARQRMNHLIDCFGLARYLKYPVSSYSGGVKRRLDIALNMMSNPEILFLDEPTTGMDIQSRMAMWDMLTAIKTEFGTTVFLTTHYLEEADRLSDTVCIMKNGREVIQGAPDTLRGYLKRDIIKITFETKEQAATAFERLRQAHPVHHSAPQNNAITINTGDSRKDFMQINNWLMAQDICFTGIEIAQPSLDDVFIRLTSGAKKEGCA